MLQSNYKRITNLISSGVSIDDLRVFLPGKGSTATVLAATADGSADLKRNRHLVKVELVRTEKPMPVWPFIKQPQVAAPPPPPSVVEPMSSEELQAIRESTLSIETMLRELLTRPSPASADVVAAHVHAIRQRGGIPDGLVKSDAPDHPMFIQSRIVPEDTEAEINAVEDEVQKDDFDAGMDALRRARKK